MKNMANLNNYSNEPIGEWKIGGGDHFIAFALTKKPHWFHRLSARFFFGLRWVDYVDGKGSKPSKKREERKKEKSKNRLLYEALPNPKK